MVSVRPKGIRGYRPVSKRVVAFRAARTEHRRKNRPLSNAEQKKSDQVTVGMYMYYALRNRGEETLEEREKRQKKRDKRRKSS